MAFFEKKNNAIGRVNNNPLTAAGVTLNLESGQGASFPSSGVFVITVWDNESYPNPGSDPNMEIMWVSSRSTDALTVVRAKESTTGVAHAKGSRVEMLVTTGLFTDPTYGYEANLSNVLFSDDETPSGTVNSSNKTFTTANTPSPVASLDVKVEGMSLIRDGAEANGYSLSGKTITVVTAPPIGAAIRVSYRYT